MEQLTAFERGQIVGALSTGASVAKIAELLNMSKETVSEVIAAYTKHGESAMVKRKQHKNKKTPKQTTCGDLGNTPLHALDKALALENQGEEDDEDEDMDDEDMNIQRPRQDEYEGSSEEQNDSEEVQRQ